MRNYTLLTVIISFCLFSSCSKNIADRIAGSWQLEKAWKQKHFDRDYFQTGYENGLFIFMDNGSAKYIEGTDTLTGYWRSYHRNYRYYNSGSGEWETRNMRYLYISLINFLQNRRLEWEFDDFHFRDGWQKIRAEQYWYSNDRIFEFRRK